MDTFWSPQGWRRPAQPPPTATLAQAVNAGVMFDQPRVQDHDAWVSVALQAVDAVSIDVIGDAFVESLGTRRLDLRSALSSYAIARVLPEHPFAPSTGARPRCTVCSQYPGPEQDLNVLNFERFKWGGVRRDDVRYIAFDLEQFARAPRRGATATDRRIGVQLVEALRHLPAETTASQAIGSLTMVKGNKAERGTILDVFGICGILQAPDHHGYRTTFVPADQRETPPQRFVDRAYPVSWWRGRHGVHEEALNEFLPLLA